MFLWCLLLLIELGVILVIVGVIVVVSIFFLG